MSTDQPAVQPPRRGIRRVPLRRTETYLNVGPAGSDEVERLGSALENASLSPKPKVNAARAQSRAESENAPPPSSAGVRPLQRNNTPPSQPAPVVAPSPAPSSTRKPRPLERQKFSIYGPYLIEAVSPHEPPNVTYLPHPPQNPNPNPQHNSLSPSPITPATPVRDRISALIATTPRVQSHRLVRRKFSLFGPPPLLSLAREVVGEVPCVSYLQKDSGSGASGLGPGLEKDGGSGEVGLVGGWGEDDDEDEVFDAEVVARRRIMMRRRARAEELALASSSSAAQDPVEKPKPQALTRENLTLHDLNVLPAAPSLVEIPPTTPKPIALTRENLSLHDDLNAVPATPPPADTSLRKPKPLALTKQNLTLHDDFNASELVPFPTLPASPQGVAKKKKRPRSLERKPAFRNIHDAAASTSCSVVEITMDDQPAISGPALRRSERRPLRREDTQILIIPVCAAPEEQIAGPSSPVPSEDSSLQPPPTPTRLRPRKPLPTNSKARAKAQRALPLKHCQHGTLHIQYQWYEKVVLPKGKKGYFVPVGGAMQQYKHYRKILVTPETLVGFKGLKSVHADAYAAKGEDGKRVYPDGVYVEERNTLKQELDEGDKNEKGRECVTITVRPNVFVTAVIGGEAKDVLVDCVSFGSDMIKATQSVRADQLLVHMTKEHMEERKGKSRKRPLSLNEVDVVWPEEERRRPAKRTRYAGILKVANLETKEVTLDRMIEVDK